MSELEFTDKAPELPGRIAHGGYWRSLAVLLVGLTATALLTRYVKSMVDLGMQQDFDIVCSKIQTKVMERLKDHETILLSGAAFYDRNGGVSRQEWRRFIDQLNINQRFPGIQGIGFALLIPRQELGQHLQKIRAEGFPNYQVRPEGDREFYSAIVYLEPFTTRNLRAFGYDMLSEPVRRAAMERARDQNAPALSGKVTLVQETDQGVQAGTLMFVPVFRQGVPIGSVAERRAALLGWVYSPYRMDDLLRGIMQGENLDSERPIQLEIFDGGQINSERLLFDSRKGWHPAGTAGSLTVRSEFVSAGQRWTLQFTSTPRREFVMMDRATWSVLIGGVTVSLLLAGLHFSLLNTRFRAHRIAEQLTREITLKEMQFRAVADYTVGWEIWFGLDSKMLWVNPGVERITGYSPAEVLAMPDFVETLMEQKDRDSFIASFKLVGGVSAGDNRQYQCSRKDGTKFWLSASWQPILDQLGNPIGVRFSGRDITELKQVEANLLRANWVMEQANASISITDLRGAIIYVNAQFTADSGYTKDECVGKNPRFLKSGQTNPEVYRNLWTTLTKGDSWHGEFINRRKDGQIFLETEAITPLRDEEGKVTHYVGIKRNVSEERQMQTALKMTSDRLSLAVKAAGVGIWEFDVTNNQLIWDDQMCSLYGITQDQFAGVYEAWQQGVHPDDRKRGDEEIQSALRGEKAFDTEFRVVWPNGTIRNIRALAIVQHGAAGQPSRMVGTNWDITERKQSAIALHWNQQLLQLMSGASPLAYLVVDNRTDAIVYFNQRFCEIWNIEHLADRMRRGELKNADIIPACLAVLADVPAFAASCEPLQDESNRITLEDEIAFTDHRTIRRFSTQIRDAEDEYYGRFYIFEDITERKQHEAETNALLEKEKQVSETKTRFISATSHDFRTPMAAAMGSVDLLINHFEHLAPAKRLELLARINSSLRRMNVMLDEVLLLNRLEQRRIEVQLTPVNLEHFLRELIEEIRMGDREAHRFELRAPSDLGAFVADPNLLHHIFSNVFSNAVRYSQVGTLITVRLEADAERVQVAVQDQGIGIRAADRERIFEPFERGSNVGQILGTGLGLNIVKRMTEMIGGTIAVDSTEGHGSCFTLVFPRQPDSTARA